jgi:hypothetical protein
MNFHLTLRDKKKETLSYAFNILTHERCKPYTKEFRCLSYQIIDKELYLFWYDLSSINNVFKPQEMAYPFNLEQTIEFAWGWWQNNKTPKEPEGGGDGSYEEAYEITTKYPEPYTHSYGVICKIKSIWFYYGK